jgi:hypothetical protein
MRAAAPPPPRPPSPPRPAGIGLLLERVDGEDDVHVKELTPGGAAEKDGRIVKMDVILSVDGVDVTGMHLEKVFKLILGEEGTKVTLQVQRTYAKSRSKPRGAPYSSVGDDVTTFFVTLTRRYMANLDHELGHLEISPPRERLSSRGRSPPRHDAPAQYTSLPWSLPAHMPGGVVRGMSPSLSASSTPALSSSLFAGTAQAPHRSPSPIPGAPLSSSMFGARSPNMDAYC